MVGRIIQVPLYLYLFDQSNSEAHCFELQHKHTQATSTWAVSVCLQTRMFIFSCRVKYYEHFC